MDAATQYTNEGQQRILALVKLLAGHEITGGLAANKNEKLIAHDGDQLEQFFASAWTSPYAAVLDPDAPQLPPRIE